MHRRHVLATGAALLLFAVPLTLGWYFTPAAATGPCTLVARPAALPDLREASGLAVSRRTPALLWSHNDSGNAPILFAIEPNGPVRGRVRLPIRMRDWEDVSAGDCNGEHCLYLADIGDNGLERRQLRIYRLVEPPARDAGAPAPELFTARYADGPHNAEALFVIGRELFIVTKDSQGGLYRAPVDASHDLTFTRVGSLGLTAVTDAETSTDGASVAVRTPDEVALYRTSDLLAGRLTPFVRIDVDPLREWQGEGVALDGSRLYLASEGRGEGSLLSLDCRLPVT